MIQEVKQLRVKIDGISQLVKVLEPLREERFKGVYDPDSNTLISEIHGRNYRINSPEIDKAYDSLILAKAWLGKVLGQLGEATPYKNDGYRNQVSDIEETADQGEIPLAYPVIQVNHTKPIGASTREMNHIEKADWLREEIKTIIDEDLMMLVGRFSETPSGRPKMYYEFIYKHLSEARFWLGFELQRIREEN